MARLQALALEPVRSEDDYIERKRSRGIAFDVQFLVRHSSAKPDEIIAGWEDHFVILVREDSRAGIRIEKKRRDRPAGAHFFGSPATRAPTEEAGKRILWPS